MSTGNTEVSKPISDPFGVDVAGWVGYNEGLLDQDVQKLALKIAEQLKSSIREFWSVSRRINSGNILSGSLTETFSLEEFPDESRPHIKSVILNRCAQALNISPESLTIASHPNGETTISCKPASIPVERNVGSFES